MELGAVRRHCRRRREPPSSPPPARWSGRSRCRGARASSTRGGRWARVRPRRCGRSHATTRVRLRSRVPDARLSGVERPARRSVIVATTMSPMSRRCEPAVRRRACPDRTWPRRCGLATWKQAYALITMCTSIASTFRGRCHPHSAIDDLLEQRDGRDVLSQDRLGLTEVLRRWMFSMLTSWMNDW